MSVDRNRADTSVFQTVCGWQVLKMQLICKKKKESEKKKKEKEPKKQNLQSFSFIHCQGLKISKPGEHPATFFRHCKLNTRVLKI